ncbi:MAG: thioredoxin family protein [Bacilli bacterium]|nr:thioredoxin family protein [Bacilli bacterium]
MKIIYIGAVWCPACLIVKPVLKKLQSNYVNIDFIYYDYDMDEEEVNKYQVGKVLPEIIIFDNDKEIQRIIGEKNKKELEGLINEVIK